jgi:hypothetical protein
MGVPPEETPEQQLARLDKSVARLVVVVTAHRGQLSTLDMRVNALDAQVGGFRGELEDALAGSPKATVIPWHSLDQDQYAAALAELGEWVQRMNEAYPSFASSVRSCWRAHRDAVIELGVLWQEFERIYGRERPQLGDALTYLNRWFPDGLKRVREITARCEGVDGCALERRERYTDWSL